jgi:hypothetical protein
LRILSKEVSRLEVAFPHLSYILRSEAESPTTTKGKKMKISKTMGTLELNETVEKFIEARQSRGNVDMYIDYVETKTPATQKRFWAKVDAIDIKRTNDLVAALGN